MEYLKDLVKDSSFWHLQITEKSRGINVFNDDVDHYKTIHVILLLSLVTHGVTSCDGSFAIEDIYEDVYEDELRR